MNARKLVPTLALVCALAATATAEARSSFTGDVCGLASAKQAAPLTGSPSHCTKSPASPGPGSTLYAAVWSGVTATSPRLQVTVAVYTDKGALQLARRNLKQGLPGGTPRPLRGVGTAAYEASGPAGAGIHFGLDKYVVYMTLTGKASRSTAQLEAIAKSIAAKLRGKA